MQDAVFVRVGLKRENYGRGRWTQTQLPEARSGEQKASFIKKADYKNKSRQNRAKGKVTTKNETK